MSDQSTKWDRQWSELLTRCHGEDVEADAGFKAGLLAKLHQKAAENRLSPPEALPDEDARWGRLMKAAYIPCHPEETFRNGLLADLKAKQREVAASGTPAAADEDTALRAILTQSYQPVTPRREFETRLLENLKERQRATSQTRIRTRRRTLFFSVASSAAAAAMVLFVVWLVPHSAAGMRAIPAHPEGLPSGSEGDLRLAVPDAAVATAARALRADAPSSFAVVPASYSSYRADDAFSGNPLPDHAVALQNIEMDSGEGWTRVADAGRVQLRPGDVFRADGGMGHLKFPDGSLVTVSPETVLRAAAGGLEVEQGFMLVSVPERSPDRFRLHFPERDIAVEPGTELAVMAAESDKFAEGGAPAPMVMVVNGENGRGGLALAKGKNGIGPLFASQLYRLDNYVTPDMPGRTLCDTECNDLNKLFKTETVRREGLPMALFAGGFGGADRELDKYSTVLTPAGFTKKGTRWVADSYTDEPTVKLRYLSDAYFGFANERRDLARALALGGEVVIDGGNGVFYEVVR